MSAMDSPPPVLDPPHSHVGAAGDGDRRMLQRAEALVELQLVGDALEHPLPHAEFLVQLGCLIRMPIDKVSHPDIDRYQVQTWMMEAELRISCALPCLGDAALLPPVPRTFNRFFVVTIIKHGTHTMKQYPNYFSSWVKKLHGPLRQGKCKDDVFVYVCYLYKLQSYDSTRTVAFVFSRN